MAPNSPFSALASSNAFVRYAAALLALVMAIALGDAMGPLRSGFLSFLASVFWRWLSLAGTGELDPPFWSLHNCLFSFRDQRGLYSCCPPARLECKCLSNSLSLEDASSY